MGAGQGVAIVGIGCRFPGGADTPQRYWDLLARGGDAIVNAPPGRLDIEALYDPDPGRPGKLYVRRGGYLDAIDAFDAEFFGISPREARRIDPQHRLLLEVAWEALEDGGQPPGALAGTRTGVFVGISGHDYGDLQTRPESHALIDVHVTAGTATSIAANRISYALDLRGPSLAVDTACSSALTAVHLACRSLAAGECDLAIAGAVNALITPEPTIGFCKAGMLAPDGRCKPFDAAADGYGRGEGAGAVVLKPLARALADGDPIHAVIRSTAINQDGRTPGISVPSAEAQEALLRAALDAAELGPGDVQVVEAHGTGTPVGDPREALAIGRVLGPCLIGSAKGNLGHLEAAAGIAGLIKAALALQHRQVPPSINFERPNPAIDFDGLGLRVPRALEPWPAGDDATPVAGVNSFGFGGANAHAILEAPPVPPAAVPAAGPQERPHVLALSARSPRALRELAGATASRLREDGVRLADACHTAALRRSHHAHRIAVVGATVADVAARLDGHASGEQPLHEGRAGTPKVAFVFSGMGPQWWGMGRELLRDEPVFAAAIDECDALLAPLAGWSLRAELERDEGDSRIAEPYVAHVANLALQLGMTALLRSWGVVPDAVVGHSSGEMGAACVSGALATADAVRLAYHRGRLQHRTAGSGGMLAAGIAPDEAERVLAGYERRVSLAAVNGPASLTFSGELGALGEIADGLGRDGRFRRMLDVSVPYHGPQMDALRDELLDELRVLAPRHPDIPIVSTVTGDWCDGAPLDAGYWWRNVRRPVLFATAVQRLADEGCDHFVELAPQPVLGAAVAECLERAGHDGRVLPTLRRGEGERAALLRTVGALHVAGRAVDWAALLGGEGRCIRLPTYPWQRERHWLTSPPAPPPQGADSGHPLLGRRARGPLPAWEAPLHDERLAFLDGHRVQGAATFPGAAHVELALAAAGALGADAALEDVAFERLLATGDRAGLALGCVVVDGRLEIHSARCDAAADWTLRATARLAPRRAAPAPLDLDELHARCADPVDPDELYATLRERHGLDYTGAFRALARLTRGDGEALAEVALPAGTPAAGWHVHPALLDAAVQALGALALGGAAEGPLLPVAIDRVELYAPPGERCLSHVALTRRAGDELAGDVTLAAADGSVLARCESLVLRRVGGRGHERWLYGEHWEPVARATARAAPVEPVVAAAARSLDAGATDFDAYYTTIEPALDALALSHIEAALAQVDEADVAPDRQPLHERLADIARAAPAAPAPDRAAIAAADPRYACVAELVDESGRRLAATLRGEEDAREWLVAGAALGALTELYASSPCMSLYGEAAAEAVAAASAGGPLRILEVGAGTGGTTGWILERLAVAPREYVFSDLSPFFLRAARARFPGVRTAIVDAERPPPGEGGFDVIVAADVVHATADPAATLRNLRGLLVPGGVLVLVEGVRRAAWVDLLFGQLDGWWRSGREHPLLAPAVWIELLGAAGFAQAAAVADDADPPSHVVLVATAPRERREPRSWLVLADGDIGPELAATLRERGDECALVWPGDAYLRFGDDGFELEPGDPQAWERLLAEAGAFDAIVALWALGAPGEDAGSDVLMDFQRRSCGCLVALTQALRAAGRPLPPTWLVTAGAQAVSADEDADVAQAPLWGAGRVLRTEQGAACRLVDLGAERTSEDVAALLAELDDGGDGHGELALRDGARLARRIAPVALPPERPRATVRADPDTARCTATIGRLGALETLHLRASARCAPGPGEVELRVFAAGLNFRDVLSALGVGFAGRGEDPVRPPMGRECAGVVVACGPGVERVAPGDEVIAIASGTLGSHVTTLAARVARMPAGLSFEQAATLPVAFVTARWALQRLANVAAGERVLVHSASGGVGLAAVQVARRAGAEVLATAGSEDKRAYLRGLGIEHVMDSRTLDFAGEVFAATGGEGVDVVLNALTGEAVDRSLELLRSHGRFVEIGKRAIQEEGRLGLAPFRRNLSYHALDLHPINLDRPHDVGVMLDEIVADVERGDLQPLPHRAFDLADVEPAFRHMAQARHIGKVVVTARAPAYDIAPAQLLRGNGAYVITGGLGGFGLEVARWMAAEGAGHVVLASRRGVPADEQLPALDALMADGRTQVHLIRADVADPRTAQRLLDHVRGEIAPLRGVVHAAMVLDDALLGTLDWARFEAVLAPKLAGAWNLHRLTAPDELDLFVAFSSISLFIGQVAQAPYAAGNAFLAALAAHRRARGLPALTVDWGTITGAGYVARRPDLERRLRRQGLEGIPATEACALLGDLLRRDVARIGVSSVDWSSLREAPGAAPGPASAPGSAPVASGVLRARLAATAAEERAALVEKQLLAATARVLETVPERIDPEMPLPDMGVDSLMAVELRTWLRAELGVEVPIVDLLENLSLRGLAATVLERLDG